MRRMRRPQNLQGSLRQQVILYLHAAVISSIPAFGNRSSGLVARLVEALEMTMHAPGNIIMMVRAAPVVTCLQDMGRGATLGFLGFASCMLRVSCSCTVS